MDLNELTNNLYNDCLTISNISLNKEQAEKFKKACKKSVLDNPDLDYNDLIRACKIYLNYIIDFPDLSL